MDFDKKIMDQAILGQFPLVAMPHDQDSFKPLTTSGVRMIAGKRGIYQEVRRPWLYVRHLVAPMQAGYPALPYGEVEEVCEVAYKPSKEHLTRFQAQALRTPSIEVSAWVIFDEITGLTRYEEMLPTSASSEHIQFNRPELRAGEHLVLDMHSHGHHPAFFSKQDDEDDLLSREVKFAVVLGSLQEAEPQWCWRLCVEGGALDGCSGLSFKTRKFK